MDQSSLDHDTGTQNNPTNISSSDEPLHVNEVSRPAQTPSRTRNKSFLEECGSASSPGLRNRKSTSSSDDGCHLPVSRDVDEDYNTDGTIINNIAEEGIQQAAEEQAQQQEEDTILLTSIWRTYDDVIILSLFSMFGIVFRIFSATWFRMELGVVFSEDSALGTNLPLNCCSCFLLGLFCSGRDAIGIVYSKALGGSNPYGDGRGIIDVGRGAYRGVVDAGRAGFNRARGYNIQHDSQNREDDSNIYSSKDEKNFDNEVNEATKVKATQKQSGLHRRRNQQSNTITNTTTPTIDTQDNNDQVSITVSPVSNVSDGASIAGLLGLDEEFRIGNRQNGEDEIREVQLRALTRRVMASPSLVLFPARKVCIDVIEHYHSSSASDAEQPLSRDSNPMLENHFEIGELNDDVETTSHHQHSHLNASNISEERANPAHTSDPITGLTEMNMDTFQRLYGLNFGAGWDVGTSAEEMKHQILLGLRVGFCGAVSTWSSWNSAMISLLQRGKIGEALVGYALGIQLGVVSYRFGQHIAVYIFVFRRRREAKREANRGYGLRLQVDADDSTEKEDNESEIQQSHSLPPFSSIRVIVTVIFAVIIILLCCTIFIFPQHQQFAISLLFTPFGCLGRYKLQNAYNKRLPGFPLGTFACNILSVALSGSIGSFLAGNPGPEESVVLTSMIAGFAGSLSTFAGYISEVLALIDPIIFKFDGFVYAIITVIWGAIIGFFSSQAKNWADEI